ncbi:hypothetical protein V5799_018529 [Amblyomma americanum]|uniref:Uncharacterized protein n=1 Tax=Amblyomma americanum TaxID=6943 RepID=A0AAQ4EZ96_AMBAM
MRAPRWCVCAKGTATTRGQEGGEGAGKGSGGSCGGQSASGGVPCRWRASHRRRPVRPRAHAVLAATRTRRARISHFSWITPAASRSAVEE